MTRSPVRPNTLTPRRGYGYPLSRTANPGGRAPDSRAGNPARSGQRTPAADRPAARLQRVQQRADLGGPDRELGHADRQPGRVLDPDVLDVDAGPAGRVEQPGQLAGLVGDDDLDRGELARLATVLAGDPAHPGLADLEQRGDRLRVAVGQHPG